MIHTKHDCENDWAFHRQVWELFHVMIKMIPYRFVQKKYVGRPGGGVRVTSHATLQWDLTHGEYGRHAMNLFEWQCMKCVSYDMYHTRWYIVWVDVEQTAIFGANKCKKVNYRAIPAGHFPGHGYVLKQTLAFVVVHVRTDGARYAMWQYDMVVPCVDQLALVRAVVGHANFQSTLSTIRPHVWWKCIHTQAWWVQSESVHINSVLWSN